MRRIVGRLYTPPSDAVMKLVEEKAITVGGVVLASKGHSGEMHIEGSSEHAADGLRRAEQSDWWSACSSRASSPKRAPAAT